MLLYDIALRFVHTENTGITKPINYKWVCNRGVTVHNNDGFEVMVQYVSGTAGGKQTLFFCN